MSAAGFFRPHSIAEAVDLLARHEGARCLAGGATLVAMMNARLVEPTALVSLGAVDGLAGIARRAGEAVAIGAMTRHAETARCTLFRDGQTVLREAAAQIANPPVRNMGTMGGSVAFADPAADYLPALAALDALVEIAGPSGMRRLPVGEFVLDWYTTQLAADELITGFVIPKAPPGSVGRFEKLARTAGDFAIASVALVMTRDGEVCRAVRIAVGGCGPAPVRRREAEAILEGHRLDAAAIAAAGRLLAEACDPVDDTRATAAYRRRVVPRLLARAVALAGRDEGIAA